MLEYTKLILQKVSFDARLFEKELVKCQKYLAPEELKALQGWCVEHFFQPYSNIITRVLSEN